jgi:Protein of unknown function DUF262
MTTNHMIDKTVLIESVDQKIEKVRTRSLDVSFNELLDMYKGDELKIDPEYQRLFRWSDGKQSRFIESLILEMPIPPIFVIEEADGVYELIDGLQRVSSYLHFVGQHPRFTDENGERYLRLTECDIANDLNGITYPDLPKALEIKIKRSFVRMEVLRKESDRRLRYYMFKRLNTGGELLSDQEIRNCTIRLLDDNFNSFIMELSSNADFMECIKTVPQEKLDQKYDQELVLRFFAFKNYRDQYVHDVGDFMTEYMEAVSDPLRDDVRFDFDRELMIFNTTFHILRNTLGDKSFAGTNPQGSFVSRFLSYHYEAFTLGIQPYIGQINVEDNTSKERITEALQNVKRDLRFREITTGGGKNYRNPLRDRINFVVSALEPIMR